MQWSHANILKIRDCIDTLTLVECNVLLIRLANELEDSLDWGIAYCSNFKKRQQYLQDMGTIMVEMADKIGFPILSTELAKAFQGIDSVDIIDKIRRQHSGNLSLIIVPKSYNKRLLLRFHENATCTFRYFYSILIRVKIKLRPLLHIKKIKA